MRVIELTQGQVTIVDDEDFECLAQWRWQFVAKYAGRTIQIGLRRMLLLMHCEIMQPIPDGFEVDHHNGNRLDNRRLNLRLATSSQQACNRGRRADNTSGFKGVNFHQAQKRFVARITLNGRRHHLGYFDKPEDAHEAYCVAAIKLHGEFARLN